MGTAVGCKTWKVTAQINKLNMFINRCLQRIIGIRCRKIKSNSELCEATAEKPIILPITMRKWWWICHTLRNGDESIEKQAHRIGIHREPEGVEEWSKLEKGLFWRKQQNAAKHGLRLRVWQAPESDGDISQICCVHNGTKGSATTTCILWEV